MSLTPHTIPTNEEMVESLADRFYEPHKKQIWLVTTLLLGGVVAFLGVRSYRESRTDDMWARFHEAASPEVYMFNPFAEPNVAGARKQADALQVLVKDYPDDPVTPFALLQLSKAQLGMSDYDGAQKSIEEIQRRFKDFPLNTLPADADGPGKSLSEKLADSVKREKDWAEAHKYVHHWPPEDRLALVETNVGSFWMSFYSGADEAPKHVESFVQHAKRGDYNGSQVYFVTQTAEGGPLQFDAGSALSNVNSRLYVPDPADHAKDEPTDTIEPEESRYTMRHPYRVVSAAKMDSGESATRFTVVTKKDGLHKLDGEATPFAAVVDREKSLETIDTIGRATTYNSHPDTSKSSGTYRMRDHPYPAIYIRRISVWTKEKIEDGHTWDTSRAAAGKNEPEPWELAKPVTSPKPEEFEKKEEDKKDEPKKDEGGPK
jgi:cyclophilin family peptidyl-prolyl cis-trans isomerase